MGVFPDILSRAIKHLCFDFKINQPYNNSEKMKNATFAFVLLAMALCVFMAAPSDAAESAKNRAACIDETAYAKKCAEIKDSSQKKTIQRNMWLHLLIMNKPQQMKLVII